MWLFGGSITWSKSWVNIAAAKNATARKVSLPVFSRSWRIGVGKHEHAAGADLVRGSVFEIELAGSRDDVLRLFRRVLCQPSRFPGSTS
jgi:hypothetical protein